MYSFSCNFVYDIFALADELMDLFSEIMSAEWTLRLNSKPVLAALKMEVVLWVAFEHDKVVIGHEIDQADYAIWHFWILQLIVFQINLF